MLRCMDDVVERLPATPRRPVEEWEPGELLVKAGRLALLRLKEFVTTYSISEETPLRDAKMIAGVAIAIAKLLADVSARGATDR